MSYHKLINLTNSDAPPLQIKTADNFWHRFIGLMGKKSIHPFSGLVFINNSSSRIDSAIHMLFMNFNISVFWIDKDFNVVDKTIAKKWHLSYIPARQAKYIVETHVDRIHDLNIGDRIELQ